MPQAVQEREGAGLDQAVRPAFDQGEPLQRFLGQELLVPEADQPVGHVVRVQAQVFGIEFARRPPVADRHVD